MKYKIQISMEDTDIPRETVCIFIGTNTPFCNVVAQIKKDFQKYDTAVGEALKYRENYGWGIEGFVNYLNYLHRDWDISLDTPCNTEILLIGN